MMTSLKKGFTLIELLVVITIIGILATGAVTTFTSQIQKARDATRISDIKALQSAIEQVYQDQTEYPQANQFFDDVNDYMERLPADPKHSQPCNQNGLGTGVACGYAYITEADANGILYGEYEISTALENTGNINSRAAADSGNDPIRLESGIDVGTNGTATAAITAEAGVCLPTGAAPATGVTGAVALVVINGSPTAHVASTPTVAATGECG